MFSGIWRRRKRIRLVIAKPNQILAHARVGRPIGCRKQAVVQAKQTRCPVGKIERAAVCAAVLCGLGGIVFAFYNEKKVLGVLET